MKKWTKITVTLLLSAMMMQTFAVTALSAYAEEPSVSPVTNPVAEEQEVFEAEIIDSVVLGCSAPIVPAAPLDGDKYAVYYKLKNSEKWILGQNYSTNSDMSITPSKAGEYDVCVKRARNGGISKYYGSLIVEDTLELSAELSSDEIVLGNTVHIEAQASGGTAEYQYAAYYKKKSEEKWHIVKDFSSESQFDIKPGAAVVYDICVKTKDANGIVKKVYDKVTVSASNLSAKVVLSDDEITLGNPVTVDMSATGGTPGYQYALYYKKERDTDWTVAQDFNSNSTLKINPVKALDYNVCVKVKDANGVISKVYETFAVYDSLHAGLNIQSSDGNTKLVQQGHPLVLIPYGVGGTAPYMYSVFYKKPSDEKWIMIQDFDAENTGYSIPSDELGEYSVCVKVKDANKIIRKSYYTITVVESQESELKLNSNVYIKGMKLTPDSSAVKSYGDSEVSFNLGAEGGKGEYEFAVFYKAKNKGDDEWITLFDYGNNPVLKTKGSKLTKSQTQVENVLKVVVRDEDGNTDETTYNFIPYSRDEFELPFVSM